MLAGHGNTAITDTSDEATHSVRYIWIRMDYSAVKQGQVSMVRSY